MTMINAMTPWGNSTLCSIIYQLWQCLANTPSLSPHSLIPREEKKNAMFLFQSVFRYKTNQSFICHASCGQKAGTSLVLNTQRPTCKYILVTEWRMAYMACQFMSSTLNDVQLTWHVSSCHPHWMMYDLHGVSVHVIHTEWCMTYRACQPHWMMYDLHGMTVHVSHPEWHMAYMTCQFMSSTMNNVWLTWHSSTCHPHWMMHDLHDMSVHVIHTEWCMTYMTCQYMSSTLNDIWPTWHVSTHHPHWMTRGLHDMSARHPHWTMQGLQWLTWHVSPSLHVIHTEWRMVEPRHVKTH